MTFISKQKIKKTLWVEVLEDLLGVEAEVEEEGRWGHWEHGKMALAELKD